MAKRTELLIHARSKFSWEVVQRPIQEDPIPLKDIDVLFECRSRKEAVAFAKGRQSVSRQPIAGLTPEEDGLVLEEYKYDEFSPLDDGG